MAVPIPQWLRRLLSSPSGELSRWQRAGRFAMDLSWHCAKELKHDKATQMAAALTYRTIFSLIPILVLSLVVFNAFDGFQKVGDDVKQQAFEFMGLTSLHYGEETGPGDEPSQAVPNFLGIFDSQVRRQQLQAVATEALGNQTVEQATEKNQSNRALVAEKIDELVQSVEQVHFGSISVAGIALLIWAALALASAMEHSFNQICGASEGRSLLRRVTVYWSALTLGPVLLLASVAVADKLADTAVSMEQSFWQWSLGHGEESQTPVIVGGDDVTAAKKDQQPLTLLGKFFAFIGRFTSLVVTWMLFVFLYTMVPNASVRFRNAAVGALFAAILWTAAKWGFALYVQKVVPFAKLYGSLGLIPLFLFWVYVTWLTVLFGMEVTHTLGAMKGRKFKHEARKQAEENIIDSAWLIPLAARIAEAFDKGKTADTSELSTQMNLSARCVQKLAGALEEAGLIRRVLDKGDGEALSLARPADSITLDQIVEASTFLLPGRIVSENGDPAWRAVRELRSSDLKSLHEKTLADVCRSQ